jgi:hypothetical protein
MDHYARVYSFLLRIAPRIETEIIDMERELERRKDDPRSKQGFFQNYGGGLESLSAPFPGTGDRTTRAPAFPSHRAAYCDS